LDIEQLYDRFGEKLYHYLILKLGSASDAEDVLQDVFCRLARYSIRLRLVRNLQAYVFRIARNEANRFLRKTIRRRREQEVAASLPRVIRDSFTNPDVQETRRVAESLARLPENQMEIIVLKVFEGLTFKEIAAVCGLSISTAASRYRYGMEKLRSILEVKE
jgi:RNA polymerase sigma-70 factor (ECF subfamily)